MHRTAYTTVIPAAGPAAGGNTVTIADGSLIGHYTFDDATDLGQDSSLYGNHLLPGDPGVAFDTALFGTGAALFSGGSLFFPNLASQFYQMQGSVRGCLFHL